MLKVVTKYKDSYAVIDTNTAQVEAMSKEDLLLLLYFGGTISGVSYSDTTGELIETEQIEELTDEDLEEDTEDDSVSYDEDDVDIDIYESEEESEDDYIEDDIDTSIDESEDDESDEDDDEGLFDIYDNDEEDMDIDVDTSTVSKLYSYLNDDQIKLLKRYYLWYSQRLFAEAGKDPTLGIKDANRLKIKKNNMNVLRNQGGLWAYAGFIDTGYDGGGYCTLGHPLRYMHVAWDVSVSDLEDTFFGERYNNNIDDLLDSNNCIIFGIKCISDFFEVDSDCTMRLQKAQRESLKDMEIMFKQYESGVVRDVINSFERTTKVLDIIKKVDGKGLMFGGKDYEPILRDGLIQFYNQFIAADMPLPKSMVQEIRDNIIGWETHKFYGTLGSPSKLFYKNTLPKILGKDFKYLSDIAGNDCPRYLNGAWYTYLEYLGILFTYEICGVFKYDADKNADEGGRSQKVKELLSSRYRSVAHSMPREYEYTIDYALQWQKVMRSCCELFENERGILPQSTSDLKYSAMAREVGLNTNDVDFRTLERNVSLLVRFGILWFRYDPVTQDRVLPFIEDTVSSAKKFLAEVERLKALKESENSNSNVQKEPEVKEVTREVALEYLKSADLSNVPEELQTSVKILGTINKTGMHPTIKQLWHLDKLYTYLTGNKIVSKRGSKNESGTNEEKMMYDLDNFKDYKDAIDYVLENGDKSSIVYRICISVNRYKRFSDKQRLYLDEALNLYKNR